MRRIKILLLSLLLAFCMAGCSEGSSVAISGSGDETAGKISQNGSGMEVHFIDVGQGDSTLIKVGGHAMLIDAGDNSEGTAVQSYLDSQNVEKIDYAIGTHPDADHIGGLDVVVYKFDCKKVFMPDVTSDTKTYDDVVQALKSKNQKAQAPKLGKTYSLGDATFTIIAPVKDYGDDTNDWSIGILLQYGKNRFLFTGDAAKQAEDDMIDTGEDLSADVYKASHHGSKTGSSDDFLDKVSPAYAVISCGEGNKYGHPSAQTLNNFRSRGIKTFRTDNQGTIVAYSDGSDITWNASPDTTWTPGEPKGSSSSWSTASKKGSVKDSADKTTSKTSSKKTTAKSTTAKSTTDKASSKTSSKKTTESTAKNTSKNKVSYVINEDTGKFHLSTCRFVKQMNEENKVISSKSRDILIKEGYEACKVCKP